MEPSPADASVVARVTQAACDFVGGRRVVLAGVPVAGATGIVTELRRLGAPRVLVVAQSFGTGAPPDAADADWVDLDIRAEGMMDEFRQFEALAADPPAHLVTAIDRFDPHADALVVAMPFHAVAAVAGRPVVGARRPEWIALEDKTTNDALFDRAGVRRPRCEIVAATDADGLLAAADRLAAGQGTVWSGDAHLDRRARPPHPASPPTGRMTRGITTRPDDPRQYRTSQRP